MPSDPTETTTSRLHLSSFVDGVSLYTLPVPRILPTGGGDDDDDDDDDDLSPTTTTTTRWYRLRFRYVPRHTRKPPVVVLHGGPSLDSSYLYNLADVGFRNMLFYDQLGVGHSDEPSPTVAGWTVDEDREEDHDGKEGDTPTTSSPIYSLPLAVQDLEMLIEAVLGPQEPYHLYAHSYGGALAYEFLTTADASLTTHCRSVVLSSAPTDIPAVRAAYDTLVRDVGPTRFAAQHVCRITDPQASPPPMLVAAYAFPGRVWTGMTPYAEYRVPAVSSDDEDEDRRLVTPCLTIQGEYDFVDTTAWQDHFVNFQHVQLPDCSHHGLYENPTLYAETLRNFWAEYDV